MKANLSSFAAYSVGDAVTGSCAGVFRELAVQLLLTSLTCLVNWLLEVLSFAEPDTERSSELARFCGGRE